jgi:zinc transport system substrate-binding protein
MKRCTVIKFLPLAGILLLYAALVSSSRCRAGRKAVEIFVSIPPQAYLADRVGGSRVKVHILADKGQDPHTFEPTPKQIITLGDADLYFTTGLPFEHRLIEKIKNSSRTLTVIDISHGITRRLISPGHPEPGGNKGDSARPAPEPDPHIWLSPPLLKIMADNIYDALIKAAPEYRSEFRRNLTALEKDIDSVHARIKELLRPFAGHTLLVYHPAFGYFGDTYGLRQEAVELEGKSPTPKYLARFISEAKAENAKIVFVQPQFDRTSADVIADAIGGAVVEMDPLAYNVLGNLEQMAAKIEQSLGAGQPQR